MIKINELNTLDAKLIPLPNIYQHKFMTISILMMV